MAESVILVVEDDAELREALVETLEIAKYTVLGVDSAEAGLQAINSNSVDLVVSDVNMPGMSGMQLLKKIRATHPLVPVLLMTAYGSIEHSVNAMRHGAVDYLVKPFDGDQLLKAVSEHVLGQVESIGENPVAEEKSSLQLLQLAKRVAGADATVLITGESGTGKEVLARYIHAQSKRAGGPFVAINCAAIPENMLEATLFGYEKGAFTGAYTSNAGKFEQADGGTILLDEISEMDTSLQAKILRVLQEREVERLGGKRVIKLDVRIIATSNRDLKKCVKEGVFREDLFYRLSVFPLQWLPLRERKKDILPIAKRLLKTHCNKMGRRSMRLDAAAEMAIQNFSWPGNVRELDNTLQRSIVMQDGDVISVENLGLGEDFMTSLQSERENTVAIEEAQLGGSGSQSDTSLLDNDLRRREFEIILTTLKEYGGQRKKTAEVLGISARTLRYKIARIKDCGISIDNMIEA